MKTFVDNMTRSAKALKARLAKSPSSWPAERRGSASVEFVLGSVLIVTVTVAGLDAYRVVDARSVSLHAATAMAEYVSMETAPSAAFIDDLATFLYHNEIALPSRVAFIVSAVSRSDATASEPDPPVVVDWTREIIVDEGPNAEFNGSDDSCDRIDTSGDSTLETELVMEPGDMVIVVEVCINLSYRAFVGGRLLSGNVYPTFFYQHRIVPVRGQSMPAEPS